MAGIREPKSPTIQRSISGVVMRVPICASQNSTSTSLEQRPIMQHSATFLSFVQAVRSWDENLPSVLALSSFFSPFSFFYFFFFSSSSLYENSPTKPKKLPKRIETGNANFQSRSTLKQKLIITIDLGGLFTSLTIFYNERSDSIILLLPIIINSSIYRLKNSIYNPFVEILI